MLFEPSTQLVLEHPKKGGILDIKKQQLVVEAIDVSDGHHSMNELYEHRHTLFCALCKVYDNYITPLNSRITCWKSKFHANGTMFEGWFIAGMCVNQFDGSKKQITYHLPIRWWDKFNVMVLDKAPEWDGHNSHEVLRRLMEL